MLRWGFALLGFLLFARFFLRSQDDPDELALDMEQAQQVQESADHESGNVAMSEEEEISLRYPVAPPPDRELAKTLGLPLLEGSLLLPQIIGRPDLDDGLPIVLFLHGRDEDNRRRLSFFHHLSRRCSFVLPSAPIRPSLSGHAPHAAWFDYLSPLGSREAKHLPFFEESVSYVQSLLRLLRRFNKPIVMVGFSQGGVVAAAAALTDKTHVSHLVMLSSYTVFHRPVRRKVLNNTNIHFSHAYDDRVVGYDWAHKSFEALREAGVKSAEFKLSTTGGHTCLRQDSISMLERVIAEATPDS